MTYKQRIAVPSGGIVLYVGPGGNDASGDGSITSPFRNPQRAFDILMDDYDLQGQPVDVVLETASAGQYNFYEPVGITGRLVGQASAVPGMLATAGRFFQFGRAGGIVQLRGSNPSYPLGAFINGPTGCKIACVSLNEGAALQVDGFATGSASSGRDNIDVMHQSILGLRRIYFTMAGSSTGFTDCVQLAVGNDSQCTINGDYWTTGWMQHHMALGGNSQVYFDNNGLQGIPITVRLVDDQYGNHPACGDGWMSVDHSVLFAKQVTWSGQINGRKGDIIRGGIVATGGALNIPGSPGFNFLEGSSSTAYT